MPRPFAEFVRSSDSAGVVVVPQHLPVPVVEEVLLIVAATSAEDWTSRICYLSV
jgi:hypothetical protein